MKEFLTIASLLLFVIFFSKGHAQDNAGDINLDPSYLQLKVYQFSVSADPLCSDPITIFEEASPSYQDVLTNPNFGAGQIADGTYPCVIIEFSDKIRYQPTADSFTGACLAADNYELDVCRSGTSRMTDGSVTTCSAGEDRVAMYLSTASSSSGGGADAFQKPTSIGDSANGFNLAASLIVSGTSVGKFVVNGTGKICDPAHSTCSGSACEMNPPVFSFSKL